MPIFKAIYKKLSKKWHPQAITVGAPVEMDELCKHIARMSTVSIPDAKAAIEALAREQRLPMPRRIVECRWARTPFVVGVVRPALETNRAASID